MPPSRPPSVSPPAPSLPSPFPPPTLPPPPSIRLDARAPEAAPFASAEAAWFWTMAVLAARREARAAPPAPRPGLGPEAILKCLDTLYRRRRIELLHARILRRWGERGRPPHPGRRTERSDVRLWREAIGALEGALLQAGLIARPGQGWAAPGQGWAEPGLGGAEPGLGGAAPPAALDGAEGTGAALPPV